MVMVRTAALVQQYAPHAKQDLLESNAVLQLQRARDHVNQGSTHTKDNLSARNAAEAGIQYQVPPLLHAMVLVLLVNSLSLGKPTALIVHRAVMQVLKDLKTQGAKGHARKGNFLLQVHNFARLVLLGTTGVRRGRFPRNVLGCVQQGNSPIVVHLRALFASQGLMVLVDQHQKSVLGSAQLGDMVV